MEKDGEATLGLLLSTEVTETALYPLCLSGFVTSLMKHVFQGETSGPSAVPTPPPTPAGKAQVGNLLSATRRAGRSWTRTQAPGPQAGAPPHEFSPKGTALGPSPGTRTGGPSRGE